MAYIVCQIWLYRNNLVFKIEVVPAHWVPKRVYSLAAEYNYFRIVGSSLDTSTPWDSHVVSVVIRRVFFISWDPPLLRFVKVNLDGSVRDGNDGACYIIYGLLDVKLLNAGGLYLFEPFCSKSRASCFLSIICAR